MCTAVWVRRGDGGTYCQTVGQLASALGVPSEHVSNDGPTVCLCNVKWRELGARFATEEETENFLHVGRQGD